MQLKYDLSKSDIVFYQAVAAPYDVTMISYDALGVQKQSCGTKTVEDFKASDEECKSGGKEYHLNISNTGSFTLSNLAFPVPSCEYAAITRFDLIDEVLSYDVTVGHLYEKSLTAVATWLPDHCLWTWDGTFQIFEDAALTVPHGGTVVSHDAVT